MYTVCFEGNIFVTVGTEVLNISPEFTGAPAVPRNTAFPLAYVRITETGAVIIDDSDITDIRPRYHFWEQTPVATIRQSFNPTPEFGWLDMNGDTIGSVALGAVHQGEDFRALYDILKNVLPNTGGEIFDLNDQVIIPNCPGRFFVNQDTSDTEFDVLGEKAGVKTIDTSHSHDSSTITVSNEPDHIHDLGSHIHSINADGIHNHGGNTGNTDFGAGAEVVSGATLGDHTHPISLDGSHSHGGSTGAAVGSTDFSGTHTHTLSGLLNAGSILSSLPPYVVVKTFIKY